MWAAVAVAAVAVAAAAVAALVLLLVLILVPPWSGVFAWLGVQPCLLPTDERWPAEWKL